MNKKEMKLGQIYTQIRGRLVARFAEDFNGVGTDVEDAVAKAFEYAARVLLAKTDDFDATDVERLICCKMKFLLRDAYAASKRTHYRKSVKTVAILDAEPSEDDDYRVPLVEKASLARYAEGVYREGEEDRFLLRAKAIETVLRQNGISERDCGIIDATFFRKGDRKEVAARFNTSVSNVGRVKCECSNLLKKLGPQIRAGYSEMLKELGLDAD